jgi:hypothetical protein
MNRITHRRSRLKKSCGNHWHLVNNADGAAEPPPTAALLQSRQQRWCAGALVRWCAGALVRWWTAEERSNRWRRQGKPMSPTTPAALSPADDGIDPPRILWSSATTAAPISAVVQVDCPFETMSGVRSPLASALVHASSTALACRESANASDWRRWQS